MYFNLKLLVLSKIFNKFSKSLSFFLILSILNACGGVPEFAKPKKVSRDIPMNAKERARKNIEEGRGVSLKGMVRNRSTNYEFSTSNPLWRASLETIDFMPLTTVDYSGGIIITDWYSDSSNFDESIKITVRFLSNEVRSDSLKIIVHNKKCKTDQNCTVNEIDSNLKFELQKSILQKAALLEIKAKEKK